MAFGGNSEGFGFTNKVEFDSFSNPQDNLHEICEGLRRLEPMNKEELIRFARRFLSLEERIDLDALDLSFEEFLRVKETIEQLEEQEPKVFLQTSWMYLIIFL